MFYCSFSYVNYSSCERSDIDLCSHQEIHCRLREYVCVRALTLPLVDARSEGDFLMCFLFQSKGQRYIHVLIKKKQVQLEFSSDNLTAAVVYYHWEKMCEKN